MPIKIISPAFEEGGMIPQKYTCDGQDISPPLEWAAGPSGTKSYALIMDDPDAPTGTWVHWVLFNLSPNTLSLPEAFSPSNKLANGGIHGINDFKKFGYGGPCPPPGIHRYFFKIYALDIVLTLSKGITKSQLEQAMKGHILASGELMGRYER